MGDKINIPDTDEKARLIIRVPRQVHTFLRIKGMAKDQSVEKLVLEAIKDYFSIGEDT